MLKETDNWSVTQIELNEGIGMYRNGSSAQGHYNIEGDRRLLNQQIMIKFVKRLTTGKDW